MALPSYNKDVALVNTEATGAPSSCQRILSIEDDQADAAYIRHLLNRSSHQSFEITQVSTISQALQYLANHSVNIILLDLSLPDSSGLDSVTHVREFASNPALVVITGTDDENIAVESVKLGAQDYLIKGKFDAEVIWRTLRYAVERKAAEDHIRRVANSDALTNIPNRASCIDYLNQSIRKCDRMGGVLSVLFIDFDNFKLINDTLGHYAGDLFLCKMVQHIQNCVRSTDFVARLGGDEFVVVLTAREENSFSPIIVAEKILADLADGVELANGEGVNSGCSIGIASYQAGRENVDAIALLQEADSAMYWVKKRGGNSICYYDTALKSIQTRRVNLLRRLKEAISEEQFYLNYQPIFVSHSKKLEGLEALIRWNDEEGGSISPEEFIPLLEESNLIGQVGEWVLKAACALLKDLRDRHLVGDDFWISVNVSPKQFHDRNFTARISRIVEATSIPPRNVHLEITENMLFVQTKESIKQLEKLQKIGFGIVIDDFGKGFSSMNYLKSMPIDVLKIDKDFIQNMTTNDADMAITNAMIAIAKNLSIPVVAEGVEDETLAALCSEKGCEYLQGYYFSKPMSVEYLNDFLIGKC